MSKNLCEQDTNPYEQNTNKTTYNIAFNPVNEKNVNSIPSNWQNYTPVVPWGHGSCTKTADVSVAGINTESE